MIIRIDQTILKPNRPNGYRYLLNKDIVYYSKRYKQMVICIAPMYSDGATGAFDIVSASWWIHDQLCGSKKFADGSHCTNWQASMILKDILNEEGRWARAIYWCLATLLFANLVNKIHRK